jgi:hypothetical protein
MGERKEYQPRFGLFTGNRWLNLLIIECTMEIVDYKELASKLKISPKTIQKIWRGLPCVFVGLGHDLRAA